MFTESKAAPGLPRAQSVAPAAVAYCFHCGELNPARNRWRAEVDGALRGFCCAGCLAIAQTIRSAGLDGFYAQRINPTSLLREQPTGSERADWERLDPIALEAGLVRTHGEHAAETALLLEGLTCGACVWLLESWLVQQQGVLACSVNLAMRRAHVRFDPQQARLSQLLAAVAAVGYRAHPYDPAKREVLARRESRALLLRTAVALLGMMQVMMFALPTYLSLDDVEPAHRRLLEWASLTLTLPVLFYSAAPFFTAAWRALKNAQLNMDVPVALALGAAIAVSAFATLGPGGPVYYDSITMFVALLLLARYVELQSRQRAAAAIEASAKAMPTTAERLLAWPERTLVEGVSANALAADDVVLVRPGATIPADGTVIEGRSQVEEALLTGEAAARARGQGDTVLAGCVNGSGALIVRVQAAGKKTRLAFIVDLVDRASAARPRVARLADRAAGLFTGALLLLAAITALVWWQVDTSRVLAVTFALLVISCPCALSLATPAALAAAAGALSRRHVLLARTDALETLARVTHVVLDKTGTLTFGKLRLVDVLTVAPMSPEAAVRLAARLEAQSEHPVARALCAAASVIDGDSCAQPVGMVAGAGVEATVDGARWRVGSIAFVAEIAGPCPPSLIGFPRAEDALTTLVALGSEKGFAAVFALTDALRPDAGRFVAALRQRGLVPLMFSGDRASVVNALATRLGIEIAAGDLTPAQKREHIIFLQVQGAIVAMVGDGVNDAPALAQAHVSLALAGATPLAQLQADVVVLGDALQPLADAMVHARRTRAIVVQNLAWAVLYNAIALPAAAFGYVTPVVAAIGMSVSSLVVVGNALRASRVERSRLPITPMRPVGPLVTASPA